MNELGQKIADLIRASGPIPFISFMELALYCPVYGYYEKEEDRIGVHGDYCTSVNSGPFFGELLARKFAEWAKNLGTGQSSRIQFVEGGAHQGSLAADILKWVREHKPGLYETLEYVIVEPSQHRREWQKRTLSQFGEKVKWAAEPGVLAESLRPGSEQGIEGIIFSNELLDAMPVHRLAWDAATKTWREWGVDLDPAGQRFRWTLLDKEPAEAALPAGLSQELLEVLPDGFTIETCPAARRWWGDAARALCRGYLLTIDYGLDHLDFFTPERSRGTLRAHSRHTVTHDVLRDPGNQDITAHIDFEALRDAGESAGLRTTAYVTQAQFLTRIVERLVAGPDPGGWKRQRRQQFQALTHPDHFGRAFRVLVQARF